MKPTPNRRRTGFTLVEMLVVLCIVLLVTAVCATGITAARDAYVNVVDASNAQLLLSTSLTRLRDELSTAFEVSVEDNVISYRNSVSGKDATISNGDRGILLTEYDGAAAHLLVSDKTATARLKSALSDVSYDPDAHTLTLTLTITRKGAEMVTVEDYIIATN